MTIVMATVVVDRESHRRIVLGTGGRLLRDSGTAARLDSNRPSGGRFFLELTVAARPRVAEDPRFIAGLTS